MIISASRRTDIPAFYSQWFINRIREGWCRVVNPMNSNQLSDVSLSTSEVDAIVFWSKNPFPLLKYLDELDSRGYLYYFQYTINAYPKALEPCVPSLKERLDTFLRLSERIGPSRVVWRYDPIIISNKTPIDWHVKIFSRLAESLQGATERAVISLCDFYKKTDERLSKLERKGLNFDRNVESAPYIGSLLKQISEIAQINKMGIFSCAEEIDYSEFGVAPGRCIDERLIKKIWSINLKYQKDPTQRSACLCIRGKDIGVNDTCLHGCTYCYSTRSMSVARMRNSQHDPNTPALWVSSKSPQKPNREYKIQKRLI